MRYTVRYPEGFDEYAWEVESKGILEGVLIETAQGQLEVTFYEPVRLSQDATSEFELGASHIVCQNIVIVPTVTRKDMDAAIAAMAANSFAGLVPIWDL